jgi:hypothetical protein
LHFAVNVIALLFKFSLNEKSFSQPIGKVVEKYNTLEDRWMDGWTAVCRVFLSEHLKL